MCTHPLSLLIDIVTHFTTSQMSTSCVTMTTFLLLLAATTTNAVLALQELETIQALILDSKSWVQFYATKLRDSTQNGQVGVALSDCARFYDENEYTLETLLGGGDYTSHDARTWLSGVLTNHRTCLDGLDDRGFNQRFEGAKNLTVLLDEALALSDAIANNAQKRGKNRKIRKF